MSQTLSRAKELLIQGNACALVFDKEELCGNERGVAFLYSLVKSGRTFCRYSVADKIVGKAAACLLILLQVKEVYAQVTTQAAIDVLISNGIVVEYGEKTDAIINRSGTDICPMEKAVKDCVNPADAYSAIAATIEKMKEKEAK